MKAIYILELPKKIPLKTLKKQYRKKIKENHPDTCSKKENSIIVNEIKDAYLILLNYIENIEIDFSEKSIKMNQKEFVENKMKEWEI